MPKPPNLCCDAEGHPDGGCGGHRQRPPKGDRDGPLYEGRHLRPKRQPAETAKAIKVVTATDGTVICPWA